MERNYSRSENELSLVSVPSLLRERASASFFVGERLELFHDRFPPYVLFVSGRKESHACSKNLPFPTLVTVSKMVTRLPLYALYFPIGLVTYPTHLKILNSLENES